ncbi:hypothetical protein BC830DRAFT_919743 [Chytriomyces sp. MP71]|nr:hypothetical protein BC830DRAFT_919743 [Chytriomyces sp. MP71]
MPHNREGDSKPPPFPTKRFVKPGNPRMQLLRSLSTKKGPSSSASAPGPSESGYNNAGSSVEGQTLARMPTFGRTARRPSASALLEPVFELSATGQPLSAPAVPISPMQIDYSLRALTHAPLPVATAFQASLDRANNSRADPQSASLQIEQPKASAFNTSKAAHTNTLKWWQAPGVTKETAASIAAAAEESSDINPSLPRSGSLPRNMSMRRNPGSNSNPRPGVSSIPKLGYDQYDEMALIKANNTEAAAAKGPQFGTIPRLVDRFGAGATVQVIHNFTAISPQDLSVSQDDTVRILRVDSGGWVHVKLAKQGGSNGPVGNSAAAAHRAGISSRAGMEGAVPLGVLDVMRSKRVIGAGSFQENDGQTSSVGGYAQRSATVSGGMGIGMGSSRGAVVVESNPLNSGRMVMGRPNVENTGNRPTYAGGKPQQMQQPQVGGSRQRVPSHS